MEAGTIFGAIVFTICLAYTMYKTFKEIKEDKQKYGNMQRKSESGPAAPRVVSPSVVAAPKKSESHPGFSERLLRPMDGKATLPLQTQPSVFATPKMLGPSSSASERSPQPTEGQTTLPPQTQPSGQSSSYVPSRGSSWVTLPSQVDHCEIPSTYNGHNVVNSRVSYVPYDNIRFEYTVELEVED